jgi:hypothetical protein
VAKAAPHGRPTGNTIAFTRTGPPGELRIIVMNAVMNADGSGQRNLTRDGGTATWAR